MSRTRYVFSIWHDPKFITSKNYRYEKKAIINGSYNKFDKFRNASVFISMKSYRVLFTSYNFAYIRPKTIDKGVVLTVVS